MIEMLLAWALVLVGFLAVVSIVYDGIILPELRWQHRLKLYRLRDDLRHLKLELQDGLNDDVFSYLQSAINNSIALVSQIDLGLLVSASVEMKNDSALRDRIAKRENIVSGCSHPEVVRIRTELGRIFLSLCRCNSLLLLAHILPILWLATLASKIWPILSTPESELPKLMQRPLCP